MRYLTLLVLTATLALPAFSQQKTFGDWWVIRSNDGKDLIAGTSLDDDKYVAFRCFSDSAQCIHIIVADIQCNDGQDYPILVNAPKAAAAIVSRCSKNDGTYELFPGDYDAFHDLLEGKGQVGFAVPMSSGQFKVVRFSLNGAMNAMNYVEQNTGKDSAQYK